ncbi:hypothetical protein NKG94_16610 [Micromonospora sp. M12]
MVAQALDGLEAGKIEVIADKPTANVKASSPAIPPTSTPTSPATSSPDLTGNPPAGVRGLVNGVRPADGPDLMKPGFRLTPQGADVEQSPEDRDRLRGLEAGASKVRPRAPGGHWPGAVCPGVGITSSAAMVSPVQVIALADRFSLGAECRPRPGSTKSTRNHEKVAEHRKPSIHGIDFTPWRSLVNPRQLEPSTSAASPLPLAEPRRMVVGTRPPRRRPRGSSGYLRGASFKTYGGWLRVGVSG